MRRIGRPRRSAPRQRSSRITQSSKRPSSTYDTLYKRLQELAFLNRGVRIVFMTQRKDEGEKFCYERGIIEFVEHLNRASESDCIRKSFTLPGEAEGVGFEIAMQYSGEYTENLHSYVNNIHTMRAAHTSPDFVRH